MLLVVKDKKIALTYISSQKNLKMPFISDLKFETLCEVCELNGVNIDGKSFDELLQSLTQLIINCGYDPITYNLTLETPIEPIVNSVSSVSPVHVNVPEDRLTSTPILGQSVGDVSFNLSNITLSASVETSFFVPGSEPTVNTEMSSVNASSNESGLNDLFAIETDSLISLPIEGYSVIDQSLHGFTTSSERDQSISLPMISNWFDEPAESEVNQERNIKRQSIESSAKSESEKRE